MKIRSIVNKLNEEDFPRIMISESGIIVMFDRQIAGRHEGMVIGLTEEYKSLFTNSSYYVGYQSSAWMIEHFKDFNGPVILKNDD